tara:strand:- start:1168 stop:1452 length:285 start_codon:yes stop_codon:yes gene_type:complete
MANEKSINETLEFIRKTLEDDNSTVNTNDILILNKQINEDGTINYINADNNFKNELKDEIDKKINVLIEENFEKFIEKKLPQLIEKYLTDKSIK